MAYPDLRVNMQEPELVMSVYERALQQGVIRLNRPVIFTSVLLKQGQEA